jgi:thiosulfate/3-mercaptopyruvate sulfurtransferase
VDLKDWVNAITANQSRSGWETRIGALAIDRDTPVVICDDGTSKDAACLRAILRYWGIADVRLLNGGWHAWVFAGARQDTQVARPTPRSGELVPVPARLLSKEQVVTLLRAGRVQIIDAGSFSTYVIGGETQPAAGDGAGVKRMTWASTTDIRRSSFMSALELDRLFRSAGIDPTQPTVVCGDSLGESATVAFALELLGAQDVQICFSGWEPDSVPLADDSQGTH